MKRAYEEINDLHSRIGVERGARGAAEKEVRRLRKALGHIAEHARLDFSERGIVEAQRYALLAEDALND